MEQKIFTLPEKFTENQIGEFINKFYDLYKIHSTTIKYIFDFSNVEWVSNEELLVFTGLLKTLINNKVEFYVTFLARLTGQNLDSRRAKNIIQIWDTWKIFQVLPNNDFNKYFDIDGNTIDRLRRNFNIPNNSNEIYNRFGVTPFVALEHIENFNDKLVTDMLEDVYRLNDATNEILQSNNCYMPFENRTLGAIVTKELYENFLDHYENNLFHNDNKNAFLCIALNGRKQNTNQHLLDKNFKEESLPELKSFYFKNGRYINNSMLQLSFVDFGIGIPTTLREEYLKYKGIPSCEENEELDSQILEFAFKSDSSKNPIALRYSERALIPRGLFDLLSIVKRFNGLITIRSNYGKIYYDFSVESNFINANNFKDNNYYFPGTLISIFLPERNKDEVFENTTIKPFLWSEKSQQTSINQKIINLYSILQKIIKENYSKNDLYSKVIEEVHNQIGYNNNGTNLIYVDFKDYTIDERISKKIIYFLLSDYKININNNVIIINPPPLDFLKQMQDEISYLSNVVKEFIIHPLPFIELSNADQLSIFWLGVFHDSDISKLNDLLLEIHSLRKSDFLKFNNIVGNVNYYDKFGNLKSFIDRQNLLNIYKEVNNSSLKSIVNDIITNCFIKFDKKIFLCNGNYYQDEYLQMYDVLSDRNHCEFLSNSLFEILEREIKIDDDVMYLSLTPNSGKIARSLIAMGKVTNERILQFDDFEKFLYTCNSNTIPKNTSFILICDVTSTGYLLSTIENGLKKSNSDLLRIAVLINAIDYTFDTEKHDYKKIDQLLTALHTYPIKKYKRKDIKQQLIDQAADVIRIDPYTFSPVLNNSPNIKGESQFPVLLSSEEFIRLIPAKYIKAGYFRYNSLIHPYFFDMGAALKDPECSAKLLKSVFGRLPGKLLQKIGTIFFPKNSGISQIDFSLLRNTIFKKHNLQIYQLERYGTNEGWRFPILPNLIQKQEYTTILILDDGSCSGESIIQMINEISSLKVEEIVVLSIIGRVSDHKKDFFTKLKSLSGANNGSQIKIEIYFGSHWHIPTYYIEENPVVTERNWLELLLDYPNLPITIKNIARNVHNELSIKEVDGNSNKFLLKKRDGIDIIKDLILKKDEIGKISSYHLYTDYFNFFDDIIKTYEEKIDSESRYQKIELVCAVFLHEPYLFSRVKKVLPDLTEKIEEFIQTILFGNPNRSNQPRLEKEKLFHKWSNKNLIHLLFIVFQGEKFTRLITYDKYKILINDFCKSENDLNYLFFKLLAYYRIGRTDVIHNYTDNSPIETINLLIDKRELTNVALKSLKRFRAFTMSLPSSQGFDVLLTKIKHNYSRLIDDKAHKTSLTVQRDILVTQLEIIKIDFKLETERKIKLAWEPISEFVQDLLSFSKTFPDFFLPCEEKVYNKLEVQKGSLRSLFGEINEIISSLESTSNFDRILKIVETIFEGFIESETEYFKIFVDGYEPIILDEIKKFVKNLTDRGFNVDFSDKKEDIDIINKSVNIPSYFIGEILLGEMLENFRHSDINKTIKITWTLENDYISILFQSSILSSSQSGGGSGIARLEKLNNIPNRSVGYRCYEKEGEFNQYLKLKII